MTQPRSALPVAPPTALALTVTLALISPTVARADDPAPAPAPAAPPAAPLPTVAPAVDVVRVGFDEALRRALARNPNVEVATEEVRRAEALVEQVRASSLPVLTAGGTYTRLDSDRVLNGNVIAAANQLSGNVTLNVPIVVPQRWVQWQHARLNVATAQSVAVDVRRQVASATAHAYLQVIAQHRSIEVLDRARQTAAAHLEFATARFNGGLGNRIDQVRAAQEVALATAQSEVAYGGLVRAREALGVLLGESSAVDVAGDDVLNSATPGSQDAHQAEEDAAQHRADVRVSQQRVAVADRLVRDAWADYLPYLVGTAQGFYQNPPTLTQPEFGWQAQLILAVPLYDGGLRYGQQHERRALLAEARVGLDAVLRQARAEVRAAIETVQRADAALAAARESQRLADESLSLASEAYRAGATTNIEVIDAERRARDAATNVAAAEDDARQARLDLLLASGRFP